MKLEFTKLIDKYGLKPPADIPAAEEPVDLTVTAEAVTTAEKAKEYLSLFRKAEHVTLLALPDLSGVIVDFVAGESTAVSAEFYFSRYEGDWNALLRALFSNDIKKVSHTSRTSSARCSKTTFPSKGSFLTPRSQGTCSTRRRASTISRRSSPPTSTRRLPSRST